MENWAAEAEGLTQSRDLDMLADDVLQAAVEKVVGLQALFEGQELVVQVGRCAAQGVGRPFQILVDQVAWKEQALISCCTARQGISREIPSETKRNSPRTKRATSECRTIDSMAGLPDSAEHHHPQASRVLVFHLSYFSAFDSVCELIAQFERPILHWSRDRHSLFTRIRMGAFFREHKHTRPLICLLFSFCCCRL